KTAGTKTVVATDHADNTITGSASATVVAAAADHLVVTTTAGSPQTAGVGFDAAVSAKDQFGNTDTGYGGIVDFSSNDAQAVLPASSTLTNGTKTFTNVKLETAGTKSVTATDHSNGSITGSASVTVVAAAADHLVVTTTAGSPQTAGVGFDVTVTAKDTFGNVDTGYTGTVDFSSTDAQAVLPSSSTLTNGTKTSANGVTLKTAGSQTVTATDHANGAITGNASVTVTHAGVSAS